MRRLCYLCRLRSEYKVRTKTTNVKRLKTLNVPVIYCPTVDGYLLGHEIDELPDACATGRGIRMVIRWRNFIGYTNNEFEKKSAQKGAFEDLRSVIANKDICPRFGAVDIMESDVTWELLPTTLSVTVKS